MSNRPNDGRYVAELPSGVIKSPKLLLAGEDLYVNDAVYSQDLAAYPMYGDENNIYGIVAANCKKGGMVLIAAYEGKS